MPSTVKGPHVGYYDPGIAYMLYIEVGLVFMSIQCKCCKTYMQDIPAYMQHTVRPNLRLTKPWLGQLWSSPNHNNVSRKYSGRLCWHQTYNAHSKLYVASLSDAGNIIMRPAVYPSGTNGAGLATMQASR